MPHKIAKGRFSKAWLNNGRRMNEYEQTRELLLENYNTRIDSRYVCCTFSSEKNGNLDVFMESLPLVDKADLIGVTRSNSTASDISDS